MSCKIAKTGLLTFVQHRTRNNLQQGWQRHTLINNRVRTIKFHLRSSTSHFTDKKYYTKHEMVKTKLSINQKFSRSVECQASGAGSIFHPIFSPSVLFFSWSPNVIHSNYYSFSFSFFVKSNVTVLESHSPKLKTREADALLVQLLCTVVTLIVPTVECFGMCEFTPSLFVGVKIKLSEGHLGTSAKNRKY